MSREISKDLILLSNEFYKLNWNMIVDPTGATHELVSQWLGNPSDEIMLCAFRGKQIDEPLHRQDFFFFNFAYVGGYEALYNQEGNRIKLPEGDCYIGQPFSGYALKSDSETEILILGVLIRTDIFYRDFLPILSQDLSLLRFFLAPSENRLSDEMIHLSINQNSPVWNILRIMVYEYLQSDFRSQEILKSLALSICMYISRELKESSTTPLSVSDKVLDCLRKHQTPPKLEEIAKELGYHPNYLSTVIRKETGDTYTSFVLRWRMERANLLISNTNLSIEKISNMLGYSNTSNFYKAYKTFYGIPIKR